MPGSPGKFRLQEAIDGVKSSTKESDDIDKENAPPSHQQGIPKRVNSGRKFSFRRPHPQIFVRPPSGSSTHTQHLY